MSIRPQIEAALSQTAERLSPGSSASALRHARNDFATILASSEDFDRRYADETVRIAAPAVFEAKHPEGDPVRFDKKRDGLIVVYSDSLIFVRGMGFGAREVEGLRKDEVTVEPVTAVLDDAGEVPGLRIAARSGKPRFALVVALPDQPSDPVAQSAVRDEIVALLAP
jgi:hypothetical protein